MELMKVRTKYRARWRYHALAYLWARLCELADIDPATGKPIEKEEA